MLLGVSLCMPKAQGKQQWPGRALPCCATTILLSFQTNLPLFHMTHRFSSSYRDLMDEICMHSAATGDVIGFDGKVLQVGCYNTQNTWKLSKQIDLYRLPGGQCICQVR